MVVMPDLDTQVTELENWLKTQAHLPQAIEKTLLKRFVYSLMGDLEGAKNLLKLNYKLRNKYPHVFLQRDPLDESSQRLLQVADLVPLPGLTPDSRNKLLFYRLVDHDAEKFSFVDGVKVFFMIADCRFAIEDEAGLSDGEVPIFDMAGFSLRHVTKIVFSALRIYMKFVQEAHPVRLRQIHVLNCPSYLDKVLMVVKPFIKSEVFKLIHFHLPNAETPYKYFPQAMLPAEYGGQAGPMAGIKAEWLRHLSDKRDYLMDAKRWRIEKKEESREKTLGRRLQNLEID